MARLPRSPNRVIVLPDLPSKVIDRCLETTTVRRMIEEAAQRCGMRADPIASFSGHSMRVGVTRDFLKRVFDTAAIMRAGGLKSVNLLARYLAEQSLGLIAG